MSKYQQRLDELSKLEDNWDSYGGQKINDHSLECARGFAEALESGDLSIIPTCQGNIVFSWLDETVEILFDDNNEDDGSIYIEGARF